jgi:FtsP/CotA-like multicopper oxidase with cupredoxin domain
MSSGAVTAITGTNVGWGYTTAPNVTITGDGSGATAVAVVDPITNTISGYRVTNSGTGYTTATVTVDAPVGCVNNPALTPPLGVCATATAIPTLVSAGSLLGIQVTNPGSGFTSAPQVSIAAPPCTLGANCVQATAISSINSEVTMVPAHPHTGTNGIPPCSLSNIDNSMGPNLAKAQVDANGNPINGTGLEAGCYPDSWPTDGRDGGVPDPLTAGPAWVEIGTEGGALPAPVVIPPAPVSYEYNRRSITVLNIFNHGLLLGPAERADVVVDFSKFAGQTILLYNDAPAPVPAFDSRIDYYTGDPDQTSTGGAPSTLPGYGPNTRTIIQVNVRATASGPTPAFNVAPVATAMTNNWNTTQDKIIIPQTVYPSGNGGSTVPHYSRIQDNYVNAWYGNAVGGITLNNGGSNYQLAPMVSLVGGGGSGATATAAISGVVSSIMVDNAGSGYQSPPTVTITGNGTGAAATSSLKVVRINVNNGGSGYRVAPTVTLAAPGMPGGTTATASATLTNGRVTAITVLTSGSGYSVVPAVTITRAPGQTTGSGAQATAVMGVSAITVTAGGANYTSPPTVTLASPPGGTLAQASAVLSAVVTSVTLTNPGSGYTSEPTVVFTNQTGDTTGAGASATANSQHIEPKAIQELFTLDYGRMNATLGVEMPFTNFNTQTTIPYGYVEPPTEMLSDGEYQLWKITHNGVDTHFIHFHLFNVQVINRVGWDGAIKPPEANEIGWKDTVRMNPLEDIIVAIKVLRQKLPWELPLSQRPLDVTSSIGSTSTYMFSGIDPANQPAPVTNDITNFGFEYVWHCHILGHEENDMMRTMVLGFAPQDPSNFTVTIQSSLPRTSRAVKLTWKDNSLDETGFIVQRSTDAGVTWTTSFKVPAMPGIGNTVTYYDRTVAPRRAYWYRVLATNVTGYTKTYGAGVQGYPNIAYNSQPTSMLSVMTNNSNGTGNYAFDSAVNAFIFAHNFENSTAGWAGLTGNVLVISPAAIGSNAGVSGMAVDFGPAPEDLQTHPAPEPAYVYDTTVNHETQYDASFMFSPNGSDSGSSLVDIFTGQDDTGQPVFGVQYQIDLDKEAAYHIRGWAMQGGQKVFTPVVDISNAAHYIEVAWKANTRGGLVIYVDNTQTVTIPGTTGGQTLSKVLLGPSSGMTSTTSGKIYLDDFSSSRLDGVQFLDKFINFFPMIAK